METILLYLGAVLTIGWGIAHLIPTANVVKGFGEISIDNQHIIRMEWINEGVTLIFIGVLVAVVTAIDYAIAISRVVYLISILGLIILSIVSLFTGFKVKFLPFRLCPVIFSLSALLILVGGVL